MFLSAVMMLDHIGETDKAGRIRQAIAAVVKEGKVRTYDMMRILGGAKAIGQGAASTVQMTDAVLAKLAKHSGSGDGSRPKLAKVSGR
jgi:3-isopropylmalate dehydrogenase